MHFLKKSDYVVGLKELKLWALTPSQYDKCGCFPGLHIQEKDISEHKG